MANLIGFDKNRQNLEFKGHSKLSINFMSNYLYVEPENEAFKLISSSFEWQYFMKKNLLFVFAEFNFLDFCLAFKNEQICKKIYDYIGTGKKDTQLFYEPSIDANFLIPIFQKIAENPRLNSDLIQTIATWHHLLDEDEKEKYANLMREYDIYDFIFVPVQQHKTKATQHRLRSRKRKFVKINKKNLSEKRMNICSKIILASQFQFTYRPNCHSRKLLIYSSDKKEAFHEYVSKPYEDYFQCINCEHQAVTDVDENGKICVKVEERMHYCSLSKKLPESYKQAIVIRKPDYQIFEISTRYSDKIMVIFDSCDRNLCHEYCWSKQELKFSCLGCICTKRESKKGYVARARCFNEGTEKEYIEIISDHKCEKRKFQLEKFRQNFDYLLKPNFEIQKFNYKGKEFQRLIIFDNNDSTKFYKYFYNPRQNFFCCRGCLKKGRYVSAKLRQNADCEEYVILSDVKHICEIKTTISNKITLHPPEFQYLESTKTGKPKVFVFDKCDPKKCYVFFPTRDGYACSGCETNRKPIKNKMKNKIVNKVTGKLLKDEKKGELTFQMKPNQTHICEPRPYQPEKYEVQILPKTYDFFYYRQKSKPNILKLAIIHPENKIMCFEFTFDIPGTRFRCTKCHTKKNPNHIYLKPQKDADEKEFFYHDWKKHICEPAKVSTICPPEFVLLKESGIDAKPKTKPTIKIDETKIVGKPDYELRPNKAGDPDKKLIIFHPTEKTLCYEYYFHKQSQGFRCGRCGTAKICVSAKFHKTEDETEEEFLVLGKNDHICEPTKVSSSKAATLKKRETAKKQNHEIEESKIVRKPNFELRPNKAGVPDKRLIVLHPIDKSLCYEFIFKRNQVFICNKCSKMKNYLSVKLSKDETNNEMFVELGTKEHVCQPVKHQPL